MSLTTELRRVMEQRETLSREESRVLMHRILSDPPPEVELAALLGALSGRGETAEELAGFVEAMRSTATVLPLSQAERAELVDTCGTGGDSAGTFNISTAAALVAAAAGATVAKHGNRAVTSRCGSADVLEALGVPIDLTPGQAADALRRHRFAFLHAPAHHPAMRAVMPVRRALGVRTVFNLFGPLSNPAGAARQVMGVFGARQVRLVAQAMTLLGTHRALVVHGDLGAEQPGRGIDELSISGPTQFAEVLGEQVTEGVLTPADAGLRNYPVGELRGDDPQANARILQQIFAGDRGAAREVVLLNAGAVLLVADCASDLREGAARAAEAIDSGAVTTLVNRLREAR